MNEKLKAYAKCDFQTENPKIVFSETEINKTIGAEQVMESSFTISSVNEVTMTGSVDVNHSRVRITDGLFNGNTFTVQFRIDARGLEMGECIEGEFYILTNGGEYTLPFSYAVSESVIQTKSCLISNLDSFAEFAKEHWEEAVKIFASTDFVNLLYDKEDLLRVYRCLRESVLVSQALEEFLIYIKKKEKVWLTVPKTQYEITYKTEDVAHNIMVLKNTWGYLDAEICCEEDCIFIGKQHLTRDDFKDDVCELPIVIEIGKLRYEKQRISLCIKTVHQDIIVELLVTKKNAGMNRVNDIMLSSEHLKKVYQKQILQDYMMFRMGKMELLEYTEQTIACVSELVKLDSKTHLYHLLALHMQILNHNAEIVENEFEFIKAHEKAFLVDDFSRCYYSYLIALVNKKEEMAVEVCKEIRRCYEQQPDNFLLFWFMLYLDPVYAENKEKRLADLKHVWNRGNHSPMLYYEVCELYNQYPMLLKNLGAFELQCLIWGKRHSIWNFSVKERVLELTGSYPEYHPKLYRFLDWMYRAEPSKELLQAICTLLMKGRKTNLEHHYYYNLGVNQSLKLLGLMEYYVKSLSMDSYAPLPRQVVLYFQYDHHPLTDLENAYLFANIVKNREIYGTVYEEYLPVIQAFVKTQIVLGAVNPHLMVLYQEMLKDSQFLDLVAENLPNVLFKRRFVCHNENIAAIMVYHDESKQTEYVTLNNNVAYIDILTEHVQIVMADKNDYRYIDSVSYELENVMEQELYLHRCYERNPNQYKVLLCLAADAQKSGRCDYEIVKIYNSLLAMESNTDTYKQNLYGILLDYYYAQYEGEILEQCLKELPIQEMHYYGQQKLLSCLIIRGLYDTAFELLERYGYSLLTFAEQNAICTYYVEGEDVQYHDMVYHIAMMLFKENQYNESILRYLVRYAKGSIKDMAEIYKSAIQFNFDTGDLEERIVKQALLADCYEADVVAIFMAYIEKKPKRVLCEAFSNVQAYRYMMQKKDVPEQLWQAYHAQIVNQIPLSDLVKATYLSAVSKNPSAYKEQAEELNSILWELVQKDMLFPFMTALKEILIVPQELDWKTFCIYQTDSGKELCFQFRDSKDSEWQTEKMREYFCGYYSADFILFSDENAECYIKDMENNAVWEAKEYLSAPDILEGGNKFACLSRLIAYETKQQQDDMMRALEQYMKTTYLVDANMTLL